MWPIWKRTVNTYYMNIERREKVNREDKIMVVTFLNSQFEKTIVQFFRGHNDNEQYKIRRVKGRGFPKCRQTSQNSVFYC